MSESQWPVLERFGMLLVNNNRSKCYLQNLVAKDYRPTQVIVMDIGNRLLPEHTENDKELTEGDSKPLITGVEELGIHFDERESIFATLKKYRLPNRRVRADDINAEEFVKAVSECPAEYLIYSGPGGALLKKGLLGVGKHFLHIHPGWLPTYRGSTVMYYTMLLGQNFGCSVIELAAGIDQGPIFHRSQFRCRHVSDVDHVFDPAIRTKTLLDFLKKNNGHPLKPLDLDCEEEGSVFYIIHPVLKHLALLSRRPHYADLVWHKG